jgi:hypothetical protein
MDGEVPSCGEPVFMESIQLGLPGCRPWSNPPLALPVASPGGSTPLAPPDCTPRPQTSTPCQHHCDASRSTVPVLCSRHRARAHV